MFRTSSVLDVGGTVVGLMCDQDRLVTPDLHAAVRFGVLAAISINFVRELLKHSRHSLLLETVTGS